VLYVDTNKLRNLRMDALLTQGELGARARLSSSAINRLENGKTPRFSTIKAVAYALGVPAEQLILKPAQATNDAEGDA
jgi:transcriptional regulator with XRE-family HTH domain